MKTITIKSKGQQTNSGWNRTGCTNWWAAYKVDGSMTFIEIAPRRGDRQLECAVEVPECVTEIYIGAGKTGAGQSCDPYRETIVIPAEVA